MVRIVLLRCRDAAQYRLWWPLAHANQRTARTGLGRVDSRRIPAPIPWLLLVFRQSFAKLSSNGPSARASFVYPTLMNARDSLWHSIAERVPTLGSRYFRLLLLVGSPRSGKTTALCRLSAERSWSVVNVNLRLAESLLEVASRRRPHVVQQRLDQVVGEGRNETLLLDNTEILFNPALQLDPLRLLQQLARNRSVVSTWAGSFDGKHLSYAEPGHPEFKRYPKPDALIVSTMDAKLDTQSPPTQAAIMDSA